MVTVRDFTQVFDAYSQFEESMISAKMEATADLGPTDDGTVVLATVVSWLSDTFLFNFMHFLPLSISDLRVQCNVGVILAATCLPSIVIKSSVIKNPNPY